MQKRHPAERDAVTRRPWQWAFCLRKWLLVLHVISGIGWMGVDVALFLLLLSARTTANTTDAISSYMAVNLIVRLAVSLLCLGMLSTGLLLSLVHGVR